jgi:chemotaxis protein methyltransferase CheR
MSIAPSNLDVERFRGSVLRWLGLYFDDSKQDFLSGVLRRHVEAHGGAPGSYLTALETPERRQEELRALAQELTVTETSFFRNPDQIRAFSEVALPDRVAARSRYRRLRILSAGCSSGEEAYTLAACARDYPGLDGWDVSITGIDVNVAMLKKAAAARYSAWSLRQTPAELRTHLFRTDGRDYVLDATIRDMVSFEERNLVADDAGFWQPGLFDIIFFRNVLMYFTSETAQNIIARMARSLTPGGFLFLGHAETLRGLSSDFHLRHTHETFYYQRKDAADTPGWAAPASYTASLPNAPLGAAISPDDAWIDRIHDASQRIRSLTTQSLMAQSLAGASPRARPLSPAPRHALPAIDRPALDLRSAVDLLGREQFSEAQSALDALPPERAHDPEVLLLTAVLHTHGGNLVLAEKVCEELLQIDELNAGAHYLMALCRESAKDDPGAVEQDRIAAYLDPDFAMPRLHLGLLSRRAGDKDGARRNLRQALLLLQREDSAHLLLFGGGFSRSALMTLCRAELKACGGAA